MTPRLLAATKEHFARVRFVHYYGKTSPSVFHHQVDRRGAKAGGEDPRRVPPPRPATPPLSREHLKALVAPLGTEAPTPAERKA